MQIIPSLLVSSEQAFLDQYNAIKNSVSFIQLDVADGDFVANKTWSDPTVITTQVKSDIELHLMVRYPLEEIERWKSVPQIKRVLFHYEAADAVQQVLHAIEGHCWQKGIVLNPTTPVHVIEPYAQQLTSVMLMGVAPGYQGQPFIKNTLNRIREIAQIYPHLTIEIDGGVNLETLPSILSAGAHIVCPGSAIFHGEKTPGDTLASMQQIIDLVQPDLIL